MALKVQMLQVLSYRVRRDFADVIKELEMEEWVYILSPVALTVTKHAYEKETEGALTIQEEKDMTTSSNWSTVATSQGVHAI